jgi:hypothetical protein
MKLLKKIQLSKQKDVLYYRNVLHQKKCIKKELKNISQIRILLFKIYQKFEESDHLKLFFKSF